MFELDTLKLVTPLDPREGAMYIEPVKEDICKENIGEL